MNTTFITPVSPKSGVLSRLDHTVRNMIADHAAWRERRRVGRELRRLAATSPHLLTDIGLDAPLAPAGRPSVYFGW
ncbi:hypothetical protein L2U69_14870 [Zavarzinia compransoris]|uniref:hypothetical protein n=1 Tax=Zavarzinia marina TaxID=2911065 RepID=UPI001F397D47|nr:hypothetical protein [Zavarzinia marina]MCF4166933.1 hypothetical protein [Zavarzinia marina]